MNKKIYTLIFLLLLGTGFIVAISKIKAAGGFEYGYKSSLSSTFAYADGSSAISVTIRAQTYDCDPNYPYSETRRNPSDCSNGSANAVLVPVKQETVSATMPGGSVSPASGLTNNDGYITFTLRSTSTGDKTFKASAVTDPGATEVIANHTVTFTSPPSTAASAAPSTPSPSRAAARSNTSASVSQNSASQTTDSIPVVENVRLEQMPLSADAAGDKLPEIEVDKVFKIAGKTTPNTELIVYVFSQPKTFFTRSNDKGDWEVAVSNLPVGEHHAELAVKDSANGAATSRVNLGAFRVVATGSDTSSSPSKGKISIWVKVAVAIVLIAVSMFYGKRYFKNKKQALKKSNKASRKPKKRSKK